MSGSVLDWFLNSLTPTPNEAREFLTFFSWIGCLWILSIDAVIVSCCVTCESF